MQTVIVQLTNQNAMSLLQKLEEMHIIRLISKNTKPEENLAEKFAGKLPADVADELQKHISQSRNEWDNNI